MELTEYAAADGVGLARLIAAREVSAREVIEAAIAMIEARNPELNAVIATNFEAALAGCDSLPGGVLSGVPFLLKDANLYSCDMPTTFGSAFFKGDAPRPDSLMVERWRTAGLAILGKTNTPEFAAEFVTEPRAYGVTHNPHRPGMTVGGSSGGAAAAVASGMVPIAHATDLGGSIRIPAACTGVFGFKPTAGLNPVGPYFDAIAGGLNSDHVITRTVRDSAASLDITANGGGSFLNALRNPVRFRIGVADKDPSGRAPGATERAAVHRAAALLAELGHEIVPYEYPGALSTDWFDYLWIFDIVSLVEQRARALGRDPERDELEPLTWHLMGKAAQGGRAAYQSAQTARAAYNRAYLGSLDQLDLILTPSLASAPPAEGTLSYVSFANVDDWNDAGYGFAPYSIPSNISGQPSASCPWFRDEDGLSVGVQLSGKPGADLAVLQTCAQVEEAMS
ncbi:amidase [Paracoccus aminophilus]|uniref:6-aminohexanoate-cyclic-dimer hydrolase n=1 Tax=Paracoccus aminophilus JCM 7686 TaxID=1367847 RepID=S5XML4_PARAH|nr:amidase [Paracoccus aminophilus]AGT08519.1 6-aminohexanoate-cyclic-dimer hydrolase [Paracoccus aminophilus JCM 7686]